MTGARTTPAERLLQYGDRIRYIFQQNQGAPAARNTGIRAAQGRYIAFLDSDDLFHPRRIELQIPIAEADPQIGIVASENIDGPEANWKSIPPEPLSCDSVTLDELVLNSRFGSCGVLVRRECFDAVGSFDVALKTAEDRDMWNRIAARFRVVRVRAALWWYRTTPGSLSRDPRQVVQMEESQRLMLDKAFRMPELAGRWGLRRKALGLADLASCFVYNEAGLPYNALKRILRSFMYWPFPFRKPEVHESLVRPRLLIGALRRLVSEGTAARKREANN